MADEIVPQGVAGAGSPSRRNEPRPAATPGEPGRVSAVHDGVPEFIEPGVTGDRQSRRYAHTLRRDSVSGPIRAVDAVSAAVRVPEGMPPPRVSDVHATPGRLSDVHSTPGRVSDIHSAPVRVSDIHSTPGRTAEAPHHDIITNRASAPSDSTALYRKRTNPTLPTISPDVIAGAQPVTDTPEVDAAVDAAIDAAMGRAPPRPSPDDIPSDLPSVMLDGPAQPGLAMRPLKLPRPPVRLILSIIAAALVVIGLWMLKLAF
jgi:hypothetical protein